MAGLYVAVGLLLSVTLAAALFPWDDVETALSKRRESARNGVRCSQEPCFRRTQDWFYHPVTFNLVAFDDAATVDAMCRDMHNASSCMTDVVNACPPQQIVATMKETIKRPVDFLCTRDGRELLLSEKACWNSLAERMVIMDCVSNAPDLRPDVACRVGDGIRDCVLDQVRTTCSPKVVAFLDQFAYEFMSPFAELFQCHIRPASPENEETQDVVGVMRRGLQQLLMMRMP